MDEVTQQISDLLKGGDDGRDSGSDSGGDHQDDAGGGRDADRLRDSDGGHGGGVGAGDSDGSESTPEGDDLLSMGERAADGGSDAGSSAESGDGEHGVEGGIGNTLDALASRLEVDVSELYDVEIPIKNREPVKLGELKDGYLGGVELEDARLVLEHDRNEHRNREMAARAELSEAVRLMGDQLTPQLLQAARDSLAATMESERGKLLDVLPEWRDAELANSERDAMAQHLARYGFSQDEVKNAFDHRLVKAMHDFTKLQARFDAAIERSKGARRTSQKGAGNKRGTAPSNARKQQERIERARSTSHMHEKVGVVSDLIAGNSK